MNHFIVSARKYRPENFDSVIGQVSITSTLKNAIRNNHVGHAYLFCGPKGVGKTTCARIFAKTINCSDPVNKTEPCNRCESCISFNEGRSYNIHELDAASNNSVEDIRLLNEKVRIPPQIGKYSVYIIDEVHMLSQSAFNAFLKTLEEPPSHAIFILATTEKHKIIPTILSRCQIFDFNRIKVEDAVRYLEHICHEEKIKYEIEALHMIALKGDGAMRDALSIFDQVVTVSDREIKYQTIIDHLNILDFEYYFTIVGHLLNGDSSKCLLIFDEILHKGFDPLHFITGLASHLRDLLVSRDPETVSLLDVSANLRSRYIEQSQKCPVEFLHSSLEICNQVDINYKTSKNQRLLIEISLIKMAEWTGLKKKELKISEKQQVKADEEQQQSDQDEDTIINERTPSFGADDLLLKKEPLSEKVKIEEQHKKKNIISERHISIKDVMTGNLVVPSKHPEFDKTGEDNNYEDPEAVYENEFTQEELEIKWRAFADMIQNERPRIAVSLRSKYPRIGQKFCIELVLENEHLKDDFVRNVKIPLLTYLRRELLNNSIDLKISVEENENNGKKILYTPEEKYSYMVRMNPTLEKFKQQFNLEFE